MILKRLILILAVSSALVVTGCGSGDDASDSGSTPGTSPAGEPAATGDGVRVSMKGIAYVPESVTVKVGQKITWVNDEGVDHNVVANSGADFKSELFGQDGTFEYTPDKAGTIKYECTVHPGMDGTVVVQ